jgi:hypothetical protein
MERPGRLFLFQWNKSRSFQLNTFRSARSIVSPRSDSSADHFDQTDASKPQSLVAAGFVERATRKIRTFALIPCFCRQRLAALEFFSWIHVQTKQPSRATALMEIDE